MCKLYQIFRKSFWLQFSKCIIISNVNMCRCRFSGLGDIFIGRSELHIQLKDQRITVFYFIRYHLRDQILQAILGTFIPLFSGGFRTSLFMIFTICSIPCAIAAFILYYWNKEHIFNSILYSLPVGALAAEAIVIFIYFLGHHTFLFQLLMDVIGVLIFLFMFYKKAKSKKLFLIASVISALVFYFVFPW